MTCSHKLKPIHYISRITGNEYPTDEYNNHGYGGVYRGMKDLPKTEYPYGYRYICTKCKSLINEK